MRSQLLVSLLLCLLVCKTSFARPVHEAVEDDVLAVGSFIREVRQLPPAKVAAEVEDLMSAGNAPDSSKDAKKRMKNASGKSDEGGYYRTYGSDADGEKGYLKETYGKGDQGYKTLDTFHKRDGDKYEFETQTSYGKSFDDDKGEKQNKEKKDHEGAGTMVDTDYAGEGSEYSHYTESDDGDHGGHYEEKEPASTSYSHKENYSSGGDDEGSYESHGSYSADGEGDEGDHY